MAPRAYWKGYLKLSLVSCPIALYPATSEREKISFHQLNKETGNRIKYRKVDAETGDDVEQADIIKGFEVNKGDYIELDPDELEAVAIESKRTIDIDEFVPKDEIDEIYLNNPYYIAPDGEVGQQAFAEVRKEEEYFDDIPDEKIPKDLLELASHIVKTKTGHFEPSKFEDQYEDALKELLKKKQEGKPIERPERPKPTNVVNLMEALRRSVEAGGASTSKAKANAPARRTAHETTERPKRKKTRRTG